jgi:hypothetical protein
MSEGAIDWYIRESRNANRIVIWKAGGNKLLGRPREDNIKRYLE